MAVQRVCDFCLSDGKNNVPAVGWHVSAGVRTDHDVCKKHASDLEKIGKVVYYY